VPHTPILGTANRSADCSNIVCIYILCPISVCAQSGVENHLRTPVSSACFADHKKNSNCLQTFYIICIYMLGQQDNTGTGNICASHNCITFLVELLVFSIIGGLILIFVECLHKSIKLLSWIMKF